jgi:uncharacterized membrane protein
MSVTSIVSYLLYISLPILAIYIGYLVITKAFKDMGFTSFEAVIIIFLSFILGAGIVDEYIGFSFSNIPLFLYNNWLVGINTGGAIIPIILSVYLVIKNNIRSKKIIIGVLIVGIVTYLVTSVDSQKGIVSPFPYWLLPVFFASVTSIILLWKDKHKAAPFAYICGTIGVLIGADIFHLPELLTSPITKETIAVIGGANVFDMVFITGILAVIIDGLIIFQDKRREANS